MADTENITSVTILRWKAGMKLTCSKCGVGKYQVLETINRCPKCDHGHTVVVKF